MNTREERGLVIAATCRITQDRAITHKRFHVPSSSQDGKKYLVKIGECRTCTCPDFEERQLDCKHIFACQFVLKREQNADGSTTVTEMLTVVKKTTYKQDWPNYNKAATTEKRWFLSLLADLCAPIPEPVRKNLRGRPIPVRDAVYAACFKVFSGFSARRFTCDLEDAATAGHISRPVHFNSVLNVFDSADTTPILNDLVCRSASPLRAVEDSFAVDSSGFSGCRFDRWFDEKWGVTRTYAAWVKAHAIVGVKTNVIAAAEMHDGGDAPMLPGLVTTTAKTFTVKEVSADKAYPSYENFDAVEKMGAQLFAMFKANTTGAGGGAFGKAFHWFSLNQEDYLKHYHKRSNVESTFSMVKRVLGDSVRAKSVTAMKNECLAKFVCHNIRCVVSGIYELGINPVFLGLDGKAEETRAIIPFTRCTMDDQPAQ